MTIEDLEKSRHALDYHMKYAVVVAGLPSFRSAQDVVNNVLGTARFKLSAKQLTGNEFAILVSEVSKRTGVDITIANPVDGEYQADFSKNQHGSDDF